jgi:hypothetical protein
MAYNYEYMIPSPSIKSSPSEWWEFIDHTTSRHYYYQLETGKSQWRRPKNGEIVFMANLQRETDSTDGSISKTKTRPLVPQKPAPYTKREEKVANGTTVSTTGNQLPSGPHGRVEAEKQDPDVPVWLTDFKYDLCLIHADGNLFAEELCSYFNDLAIRCYRHYPSCLTRLRQEYEDINDEENEDPAHLFVEQSLKSSKFFMFIFSRALMEDHQIDYGDTEDVVFSQFPSDDPVHTNICLPNLLPILDGTTQEELKKYSKPMGSKIPISTATGAKRLSEMFFKKLTGQMPSSNFKLQEYLKKRGRTS